MLDAIKRTGSGNKQSAGELQDLIAAARDERAALSAAERIERGIKALRTKTA